MNHSDDKCRSLYRAARRHEGSTQAERRAVRLALAAALTTGAPVAAAGASAPVASAAAAGASVASVAPVASVVSAAAPGASAAAAAAAAGAKGALYASLGGKLVGGNLLGTVLGTTLATTTYVLAPSDPPRTAMAAQPQPFPRGQGHARGAQVAEPAAVTLAFPQAEAGRGQTDVGAALNIGERPLALPSAIQRDALTPPGAAPARAEPPQALSGAIPPDRTTRVPPGAARADDEDRLAQEAVALAAIHDALTRQDPERALALLREQDRQFLSGQLREERSAARVIALCAAGRMADAERARASFLSAYPDSPLTGRVKKACNGW